MAELGTQEGPLEIKPMSQRDLELEQDCPNLIECQYTKTSDADPTYNCVAWAVGDLKYNWYDIKVKGYYWPPGARSADTIDGWKDVFEIHNYSVCSSRELEPDFEKIAIYIGTDGFPEHVARQKGDGVWTSKMSRGIDLDHSTLEALEGDIIGKAQIVMKRPCKDGKRVFE